MREIKFRAWNKETNHMHAVNGLSYNAVDDQLSHASLRVDRLTSYVVRISVLKLMQFTGLLDKNGKEIYEGDIIRAYPYGWPAPRQQTSIYAVFFSDFEGIWALKDERHVEDCPSLFRGGSHRREDELLEVIGNIYEDPELLTH